MKKPTKRQVDQAAMEIAEEDRRAAKVREQLPNHISEINRRSNLPPEHPDHICGMMCDGQDGSNSYCARLRWKLFGDKGAKVSLSVEQHEASLNNAA